MGVFYDKGEQFLLFLHEGEYLCEKYSDDRDESEKDHFSDRREEYRWKSEYSSQRKYNRTYLWCWESEFKKAKMKMAWLISFQRILAFQYPARDHIDEIDEIDSDHRHSGRDLSSRYDRECRDEKSEHDRPRITHESAPWYIETRHKVCHRDDDSEYDEEEVAILLCSKWGIYEEEF